MPRGFEGERESERANDPSGGGGGSKSSGGNQGGGDKPSDNVSTSPRVGRQDGPGSITEGNPVSGLDALVDQINKDIASGVNVGGDTYQNQMAQGILSGAFGGREEFGIDPPSFADTALSAIGYDPQQTFGQNVIDMVVPGRNTPLGALTSVPALAGAPKAVSGLASLANVILGKMNFRPADTGGITSGMDTITEKYLNVDDTYTGRPDDAPSVETDFATNTVSPSGFTEISANIPAIPPNPATETEEERYDRIGRMFENYERDKTRELNQARIEQYLAGQPDVGVFTPPNSDPRQNVREANIIPDMRNLLPEQYGGFADPLRGIDTLKSVSDSIADRIFLEKDIQQKNAVRDQVNKFRADAMGVKPFTSLSPRKIALENLLSGRTFQGI